MNTTITHITATRHALVTALAYGKFYSTEAAETAQRLLEIVAPVKPQQGQSIRGNSLTVYRVTMPMTDALALAALLYSPGFGWPISDADLDEREYIVRDIVYGLNQTVQANNCTSSDLFHTPDPATQPKWPVTL
jgi:hypothetical protein